MNLFTLFKYMNLQGGSDSPTPPAPSGYVTVASSRDNVRGSYYLQSGNATDTTSVWYCSATGDGNTATILYENGSWILRTPTDTYTLDSSAGTNPTTWSGVSLIEIFGFVTFVEA